MRSSTGALVYLHRHAPTGHAADVFMSGARSIHAGAPDYVDGGHMSGMQYVPVVALPKLGEVGKGALRLLLCVALRRRRRRFA